MEIYILRLFTARETADLLKVKLRTLKSWRLKGTGPQFTRMHGRHVRYELRDIEAWLDSQKNGSN